MPLHILRMWTVSEILKIATGVMTREFINIMRQFHCRTL
jgi:hypothetical protein